MAEVLVLAELTPTGDDSATSLASTSALGATRNSSSSADSAT